jgi:prenyltransferase beta subunit
VSLRLQMLQVARRGALSLGESLPVVRAFAHSRLSSEGEGLDRDGRPDLYYTIFALALLQALDEAVPFGVVRERLLGFGSGGALDFVHLGALARCWAVVGVPPKEIASGILEKVESYRTDNGGFDGEAGTASGTAYGGFVALGSYQDLGVQLPDPLRLVQSLKFLETRDGAWGNVPGLRVGSTNASAAAVTLLHQLEMPIHEAAGSWLLSQMHPAGGFLAMPLAPIPDLLSTATALHALSCLEVELGAVAKERCLDFLDSLWTAQGGFHGHWADDHLDAEYTFYGLLALGHLL